MFGRDGRSARERELVITRVFNAPSPLLFKLWTDPSHLARWWGPKGFINTVCSVNAQVGGAWSVIMRSPDGTEYPCGGVYREVVEPERLVFTNVAMDSAGKAVLDGITTVTFVERDGKTEVTVRTRAVALVPEAVAKLSGMDEGWAQSLDRLSQDLADSLRQQA